VALVDSEGRARTWAAAGVCVVFALTWQFVTFNGFPNDHYVHVARARQMLLGAWPVRDFVDPGMPLTYAVSAAGRALIGDVALAELCIVALGIAIGAAATVLGASRLTRSTVIAIGVALLEVLASPRSYSYPKLLLYALGGWTIVEVARRGSRPPVVLTAVLVAIAFLFRHDHGLYLGVACAIAIALSAPDVTAAARRVALLGVTVAVLLAPWALAVQHYEGLVPYFVSAIGFSRREADISILRDWPQLHLSAGLTAGNVEAWLYYLLYGLPIVCLALVVWRRFTGVQTWRGEAAAVAALSVLALEINKGFLRNPLATRLPDAMVPACFLGAWLLGLAWSSGIQSSILKAGARVAAVALIAVTSLAVWGIGDVRNKLDDVGVFDEWDHVRAHVNGVWTVVTQPEMDARKFPSRVSASLVPFFRYLDRCTDPGDRLLVSGPYPDVFVLGRRGFAGGQVAFMQAFYASDDDQALTLARMRQESVPFVLLVEDEQASFAGSFPKVLAHIDAAYRVMAHVPVEGMQGVRVLVERQRRGNATDGETGWPCFKARSSPAHTS
jgi:hypothetical protein